MNGDGLQTLKGPAIALIITGCLNGGIGLLTLLSGLMRLSGVSGTETMPTDKAERFGYILGTTATYAIALLSLVAAPIVVFGALKMIKGTKKGLAKASAILSILPFTSCCFLLGIPVGIWALVVLGKPEVSAIFEGIAPGTNYYPPSPPGSWSS
jgi:membrane protease YdiL (CAAX protease family)